jgi:5-methylthioadenosine/S-adenosylhomocysteine deaminase
LKVFAAPKPRNALSDLVATVKDSRNGLSRRAFASAAVAAAAVAPGVFQAPASAATGAPNDATLSALVRSERDPKRRILLRGATIVTMDPAIGDFAKADLLIEGKRIAAIHPDLNAAAHDGNAIVIDAARTILIPGMIDCHRHAWEGQLRGLIPDSSTIGQYMDGTHRDFAPHYRPQDMYAGNFITALGCIDAGITTMIDCSHNSRSAAHSDAAVRGLISSGMRAVHASGAPVYGEWDHQWPADLTRLRRQFFSSEDQLVTLRIFSRGLVKDDWEAGKRLGLWVSMDGAGTATSTQTLTEFKAAGLVDHTHTINHSYGLPAASWAIIREAGMPCNACVRSDSQWALGPARLGLQDALTNGMRPGLSIDNDSAYSTDMFAEMQVAFHLQRFLAHMAVVQGDSSPPVPLNVRDLLEFATVRGAENANLADKVGSLKPGKEADIVMIRAEDVNTMPLTNAVGTVVSYANASNVDSVFIAGNARKWRNVLVGHDIEKVRSLVHQSRDYLFAQSHVPLNVVPALAAH